MNKLLLFFCLAFVRYIASAQSFTWEISFQDTSHYNLYFFEGKECFFLDTKVLTLPKDSTVAKLDSKIPWDNVPKEWYNYENYECKFISASGKKFTYRNKGYVFENMYEMTIKRVGVSQTETMTLRFPILKYANKPSFLTMTNLVFKAGTYDLTKVLEYKYESDGSLKLSLPPNYLF